MTREWKLGDRVIHAGRPEWGVGEVRACESATHDGQRCQRLTVRFDGAGVKTLSTAFADLRPVSDDFVAPAGEPAPNGDDDGAKAVAARLVSLPEEATDPFRSRRARLEATLRLYRFTGAGASLLEWATSQTGLRDPLSKFNRHELEQMFERFRVALDAHLKRLVQELRREDAAALAQVAAAAPPAAQQALRRVDGGR